MALRKKMVSVLALAAFAATVSLSGCTKRPSEDELAKLEQAKQAAESAERKLAELRAERMQLEETLAQKQGELREHEEERDYLRDKMGSSN